MDKWCNVSHASNFFFFKGKKKDKKKKKESQKEKGKEETESGMRGGRKRNLEREALSSV